MAVFAGAAESVLTDIRYNVAYLTMQSGLPSNSITDIVEDSYGFVWVASDVGGLVRYDGFSFMRLDVGTTGASLRSNSCHRVSEDRYHRLWVSLEEGTDVLDLRTMRLLTASELAANNEQTKPLQQLMNAQSMCTFCDSEGRMWVATDRHVYALTFDADGHVADVQSFRYEGQPLSIAIADSEGGGVWASVNGSVLHLAVKDGRLVHQEASPLVATAVAGRYVTVLSEHDGRLWVGTNLGLLCYDERTRQLTQYHYDAQGNALSHNFVTTLLWRPDGSLMVGTLGGIDVWSDGRPWTHWNSRSPRNSLSSDFVHCLMERHGILWVGTDNAGVMRLTPQQLVLRNWQHDSRNAASLSAGYVNAMYVEKNGTLWVGTVEGGLNRRAAGSDDFSHLTTANSRLTHNSVSALAADSTGLLWIGTWGGGVCVVDMNHPTAVYPLQVDDDHRLRMGYVGALAYDKDNNGLWIGSNGGIYFYNMTTREVEDPYPGCRDERGCIGALIDKDGILWMGCLTGLRAINTKTGRSGKRPFGMTAIRHKLDNPQSGVIDKITSFWQTADGTLWMGSNGYGLYRRTVDQQGKVVYKCYTTEDGLANNAVKGIAQGRDGHLWIVTTNGLSELDPQTGLFTNYTEADGLLSSQYYWNGVVNGIDGRIFLGSDRGLTELMGNRADKAYQGHLRFTRLLVDHQQADATSRYIDQDVSMASLIRLHERNRALTVEFSALTFGHEKQGVYSYRMKGLDRRWVQLEPGDHSVTFSRLPAGDYTLEVSYRADLTSEPQHISIDITVTPYFWRSWWFVSLLLIALAAGGAWLYRWRMAQMRRREADRILQPLEKILRESDSPQQVQMNIQSILDNHHRYQESSRKSVEADVQDSKRNTRSFMERVMAVMEQNYMDSDFGVQQFCEQMGMSRTLLSKRLNEETGQSTAQFIRNYRLDVARQLLRREALDRNIAEVAFSVGFNDPKYFTRCFSKLYGVSPSQFADN